MNRYPDHTRLTHPPTTRTECGGIPRSAVVRLYRARQNGPRDATTNTLKEAGCGAICPRSCNGRRRLTIAFEHPSAARTRCGCVSAPPHAACYVFRFALPIDNEHGDGRQSEQKQVLPTIRMSARMNAEAYTDGPATAARYARSHCHVMTMTARLYPALCDSRSRARASRTLRMTENAGYFKSSTCAGQLNGLILPLVRPVISNSHTANLVDCLQPHAADRVSLMRDTVRTRDDHQEHRCSS